MTKLMQNKTRGIALLTGGAVVALSLMPTTARADDAKKERAYKYGAIGLGVASAILILKGKNVAGAAAGAGAYYAYKKSKDVERDNRYPNYDVYSQYPDNNSYPSNNSYPDYNRSGDVYAGYPGNNNAPAYLVPRANAPQTNIRLK